MSDLAELASQALPTATALPARYYVDASNQRDYGGHDLLNLRLGYRLLDRWNATLRVNNLTDRAYADRADFAFGNYRYFPGRGRSAFVEVRYEMR